VPVELREQAVNDRQASVGSKTIDQEACNELMVWSHNKSLAAFNWLLDRGVCREQARGVLPQNLMTTFWATVDLSNLLHFLDLRDSDHAQSEIREYAKAIRTLIAPYVPHVIKEITQ
jgi:thymidylate synthase (FAD)